MNNTTKSFLKYVSALILPSVIGVVSTVYIQRNFISRYEEGSLIRELIPSLVSSDPRQVDMALLILESTLKPDRYLVIKRVVDRKIEALVDKAAKERELFPQTKKILDKASKSDLDEVAAFSSMRKEWSDLAQKRLEKSVKRLSKGDFLKIVRAAALSCSDPVLKEILFESERKISNGEYFDAYVAADWALKKLKDSRADSLIGIVKEIGDSKQKKLILLYATSRGIQVIETEIKLPRIVHFNEPERSPQEMERVINEDFLKELKSTNSFDIFKRHYE